MVKEFERKSALVQVVSPSGEFLPRTLFHYQSGLKVTMFEASGRLVVTRSSDGKRVKVGGH